MKARMFCGTNVSPTGHRKFPTPFPFVIFIHQFLLTGDWIIITNHCMTCRNSGVSGVKIFKIYPDIWNILECGNYVGIWEFCFVFCEFCFVFCVLCIVYFVLCIGILFCVLGILFCVLRILFCVYENFVLCMRILYCVLCIGNFVLCMRILLILCIALVGHRSFRF